jgi:hypothetical protein
MYYRRLEAGREYICCPGTLPYHVYQDNYYNSVEIAENYP